MDLGLYLPDVPGRWEGLDQWRRTLGIQLGIASIYQAWGSEHRLFRPEALRRIQDRGLTPMITWEPWRIPSPGAPAVAEQPAFTLQSIVAGRHDPYIAGWAEACREFGSPLFLRPMHEMNGDWYPWCGTVNGNTSHDYILAWRHLHAAFASAGARNVRWVWSPYVASYPAVPGNSLRAFYPGDPYVDVTALDGYNWGTRDGQFSWQSFAELFEPAYRALRRLSSCPVMIAEVGCAEEGGDKGEWIAAMFHCLRTRMPEVEALVWFNEQKERDWRIESSDSARNAFLDAFFDPASPRGGPEHDPVPS